MFHDYRRARQVLHRADSITAISKDGLKWALKQADHAKRSWDAVFPLAYEEPLQQLFKSESEKENFYRSLEIRPEQKVSADPHSTVSLPPVLSGFPNCPWFFILLL